MKIIVVKFGGTSVASEDARTCAIKRIKEYREEGYSVVSVVSAMGRKGEPYATDTLLSLVRADAAPEVRDLIMTCGESISACVFADALGEEGIDAVAMTGLTAGIQTDGTPLNAEITGMDTERVIHALEEGKTVVITGFQGISPDCRFNTLGRGGSDTSAAFIAAYLNAEACVIYTDVPGIAECDPRIVPQAHFLDTIDTEDMLILAQKGASVVHPRAVKAALTTGIPLKVASTFEEEGGTMIAKAQEEKKGMVGIALAHDGNEDLVSMLYHPVEAIKEELLELFPDGNPKWDGDVVTFRLPAGHKAREGARALYRRFAG